MSSLMKTMLVVASLGVLITGGSLIAQSAPVKNILLVHGAFADGEGHSRRGRRQEVNMARELFREPLAAHGGLGRWKRFEKVQPTIVTGDRRGICACKPSAQ